VIVIAGVGTIKGFSLAEASGFVVPGNVRVVEVDSLSALGGFARNRTAIVDRLSEVADAVATGRYAGLGRTTREPAIQ
jgi:hypothetical protein